jgi:hypothetical protein
MAIKSFRGQLASGSQETISLHTNTGSTGYKIKKFQLVGKQPGTENVELTGKIYTVSQTTIDSVIDFSDQTLIAAAYFEQNSSSNSQEPIVVIFDNVTFNQDIYITCLDDSGSARPMNYHIELEQVKLDLNENTVATLKDIRNVTAG